MDRLKTALADRYRVDREIGRGGMAHVFLAHDLKLDRAVALKVLRPELAAVLGGQRFLREITLAAKLEHPHILAIHDSGEADGILYYVMPYVEGESLRDRLRREKQLPLDDALQISREVADALSYAHSHGVIHRDIKPENILLESGHAVVADFGIARAIDAAGGEKLTETGVALGTPAYMSPEQAGESRDLDGRSDLYSLGCVLYEMLAGQPPFTGPTVESLVRQHLAAEPPNITNIRPSVPSWVVSALQRALAKTPADRFNPVAQFGEALAPRYAVVEPPAPAKARRWMGLRFGLAVAGVAVAAVLVWLGRGALAGKAESPVSMLNRPYMIMAAVNGTAEEDVRLATQSLLRVALDESGIVAVLPPDQLEQGLRMAGRPETTLVDERLARELAVRGAVRTVVAGTLDRVGDTYHIAIRVLDADSGHVIAAARAIAESVDDVIPMVDRVARSIRVTLGENPDQVAANRASAQVMTRSFEAYQELRRAGDLIRTAYDFAGARDAFGRALVLDAEFAAAWQGLAVALYNLGRYDSAPWAIEQALAHSERLTDPQRLSTQALHAVIVLRDEDQAGEIYRRLWRQYGRFNDGAAMGLPPEEAAALRMEEERRAPFGPSPQLLYNLAVNNLLPLGRYAEARERANRLPPLVAPRAQAYVAEAMGDWVTADSIANAGLEALKDNERIRSELRVSRLSARAAQGRIALALSDMREEMSWRRDARRFASLAYYLLALSLSTQTPLRDEDAGLLSADTSAEGRVVAALTAAAHADTLTAQRILREVRVLPPEARRNLDETIVLGDAWVAAAAERWQEVVAHLEPLVPRIRYRLRINQLTRWTLGEAYERLGALDSAAAVFEGIAAWDGFSSLDVGLRGITGPYAHRRLVLLYTAMGRPDQAREHWAAFTGAFTNPDPEYEWMVTEARAKLEELARGR